MSYSISRKMLKKVTIPFNFTAQRVLHAYVKEPTDKKLCNQINFLKCNHKKFNQQMHLNSSDTSKINYSK